MQPDTYDHIAEWRRTEERRALLRLLIFTLRVTRWTPLNMRGLLGTISMVTSNIRQEEPNINPFLRHLYSISSSLFHYCRRLALLSTTDAAPDWVIAPEVMRFPILEAGGSYFYTVDVALANNLGWTVVLPLNFVAQTWLIAGDDVPFNDHEPDPEEDLEQLPGPNEVELDSLFNLETLLSPALAQYTPGQDPLGEYSSESQQYQCHLDLIRLRSVIFKKYPWTTYVVSTERDLAATFKGTRFQELAQAIFAEETRDIPGERTDAFPVFLSYLAGKNEYGANSTEISDAQLKSLIPLRLLDIESMLNGCPTTDRVPSCPIVAPKRLPLEQLNKVPIHYRKFHKILSSHLAELERGKDKSVHSDRKPGYRMVLYADMSRRVARKQIDMVLGNLSSVALHISCLMKGHAVLPNAIRSIEALIVDDHNEETRTSNEEVLRRLLADLHRDGASRAVDEDVLDTAALMHNTLCIAVFLSPILLLIPREFNDIGGKDGLVNVWCNLGPLERPEFIDQAERELWRVIFSVAEGKNLVEQLAPILPIMDKILDVSSHHWLTVISSRSALSKAVSRPPPLPITTGGSSIGQSLPFGNSLSPYNYYNSQVHPSMSYMSSSFPYSGSPPQYPILSNPSDISWLRNMGAIPGFPHGSRGENPPAFGPLLGPFQHETNVLSVQRQSLRPRSTNEDTTASPVVCNDVLIHLDQGQPPAPHLSFDSDVQGTRLDFPQQRPSNGPPTTQRGAQDASSYNLPPLDQLLPSLFIACPSDKSPSSTDDAPSTIANRTVMSSAVPSSDDIQNPQPVDEASHTPMPVDKPLLCPSDEIPSSSDDGSSSITNKMDTSLAPSSGDSDIQNPQPVDEASHDPMPIDKPLLCPSDEIPSSSDDGSSSITNKMDTSLAPSSGDSDIQNPQPVDEASHDPMPIDKPLLCPSDEIPSSSDDGSSSITNKMDTSLAVPASGDSDIQIPLATDEEPHAPLPVDKPLTAPLPLRSSARLGEKASQLTESKLPKPPVNNAQASSRPTTKNKHKGKKPRASLPKEDHLKIQDVPFIDLTLEETDDETTSPFDTDLNLDAPILFHSSSPVRLQFTGEDQFYEFTPRFHLNHDVNWAKLMLDAASDSYQSNDPFIKVMNKKEYELLPYEDVANLLREVACIVVLDPCYVKPGFTKDAFVDVCSLNEATFLHDQSIFGADKLRKGTVNDMFTSLESEFPRALNALYFPAHRDEFLMPAFATDFFSWVHTRGRAYFKKNQLYPVGDMRWAIASTGWTLHFWHTDANGYGTFVLIVAGVKLWFVAVPKDGNFADFASASLFTGDFDIRNPHSDRWVIKLLVLGPGTTLIMRPNLPHAVITPEASLCKGGHYYSAANLVDSIVGLYHHYVGSNSISNTDHHEASRDILMRMLTFFLQGLESNALPSSQNQEHMLNPTKWKDVLCLFYLCAYFELYSALISWSYFEDDESNSFDATIKSRRRARQLQYLLFSEYSFEHEGVTLTGAQAYEDIFATFLARQAWSLIHYKRAAWRSHLCGEDGLLSPSVTREDIQAVVRDGPAWKMFNTLGTDIYDKENVDITSINFAWSGPCYVVRRIPAVAFLCECSFSYAYQAFPYSDGHVYGDREVAERRGLHLNIVSRPSDDTDCWVEYTSSSRSSEDRRPPFRDRTKPEAPTYAPGYNAKSNAKGRKQAPKRSVPGSSDPDPKGLKKARAH
ncbi:hypothetical protein H0H93_011537 [Arthromyces matolae]|nr:hypothetical protein H0H93_011537 [Arthromyces matolae]